MIQEGQVNSATADIVSFWGCPPSWKVCIPVGGEEVKHVQNLMGLYDLGRSIGPIETMLAHLDLFRNLPPQGLSPYHLKWVLGMTKIMADHLSKDEILPFGQTKAIAAQLSDFIDEIFNLRQQKGNLLEPFSSSEVDRLQSAMSTLTHNLRHELNEMPVFVVTERRAYKVETLLTEAEKILDESHIALLSDKTTNDIREAGVCIAFNVPTAAGFYSVRAVEAVARGYQEIITAVRPGAETPLGPLTNNLRIERDKMLAARKIDKGDLLNLVIEYLMRINNIYRKPLTHPEMILDLSGAITVFDASKCAIDLMLEDGLKKSLSPIGRGFF